jgi:hypothetical protein
MTMDERDLVLDGNSTAGLLGEVFAADVTTAIVTCAGCAAAGALGDATVYSHAPGVVVRCAQCSAVLIRCARIRERLVVDMRGATTISLGDPG